MNCICDVCGLPGQPLKAIRPVFHEDHIARKTHIEWVPAESPGVACSPECATFIFVRPNDMTADEKKLTAWRWRQRRAEARGLPFVEPCPMDEAERALTVRVRSLRVRGLDWNGERWVPRLKLVSVESLRGQ